LCLLAMFSLYGVEICPLCKSQAESLQSAVDGSFMKIFDTKSKNVVSDCLDMFSVLSISNYTAERKHKFLARFINSQNSLCTVQSVF